MFNSKIARFGPRRFFNETKLLGFCVTDKNPVFFIFTRFLLMGKIDARKFPVKNYLVLSGFFSKTVKRFGSSFYRVFAHFCQGTETSWDGAQMSGDGNSNVP